MILLGYGLLRIRELRHAAGLKQRQLAELACVSQATISDIENGKKHPSFRALENIAVALKVSVRELFAPAKSGEEAPTCRSYRPKKAPSNEALT